MQLGESATYASIATVNTDAQRLPVRPLWAAMDARPRLRARDLRGIDVPVTPGVYAWYRRGRAVYVGKADDLRRRAWRNHLGQSSTMGSSAFRRNVAEHLGLGAPADLKAKRVRLRPADIASVRQWIFDCAVAWVECRSIEAAKSLEIDMKTEWLPPLTKR
jgi:hypothetical protein